MWPSARPPASRLRRWTGQSRLPPRGAGRLAELVLGAPLWLPLTPVPACLPVPPARPRARGGEGSRPRPAAPPGNHAGQLRGLALEHAHDAHSAALVQLLQPAVELQEVRPCRVQGLGFRAP